MLNHVLDIVGHLGPWAYVVVFAVVFLQFAAFFGFLVPGATTAVFGGFLACQGVLHLGAVAAVVAAASIGGNLAGYCFGRRLRRPWILRHGGRFGVRAEHLARAEEFFARHGGKTVMLGRLSPWLRALTPFVAGASQLRFRTFLLYSVLGGVPWSVVTVMIGYLAGASWPYAAQWLGGLEIVVVAAVIAAALLFWAWRRRRQ
jgi:undecaprenyl-diphosphatase